MEKNHRLFLRNLPTDIDENNLEKFFGEYGKVTNIDIKDKTQNDGSKIAFINITTTDLKLNTCFRSATGKTFGGRPLQVQVAKESYLDRLKREREEAAKAAQSSESATGVRHEADSDARQIQKINIKVPAGLKSRPTKKKYNFDDAEDAEDVQVGECQTDQPSELPDFSWDPALTEQTIPTSKVSASADSPRCSELPQPLKKPEKKVLAPSEIKRLASVKEKRQTFKLHGKLISQALKSVDSSPRNNKIIFSQDSDPIVGHGEKRTRAGGHGVSLFGDDDNSDGEEDQSLEKFQHDETRNAKLKLALSNPNGDKRFVIDERFLDDEKVNDDKKGETVSNAAEADNETKWQLDILENVLGKPLGARTDKTGGKKQNKMIRYDPTSSCHGDHELVMEKPAVRAKKVKLSNVVAEEETPVPVSSEIFYEVSKNLTESLNTQEEFSLLKSFGTAPTNDKNSANDYDEATAAAAASQKEKCMRIGIDDPFKYESSDEDAPSMDQLTCSQMNDGPKDAADTFFFVTDDQRFSEAEEFFNTRPSTGANDFTNVRRQLKQIVRSKIRNNVRKNTPWRNTKVAKQPKIR